MSPNSNVVEKHHSLSLVPVFWKNSSVPTHWQKSWFTPFMIGLVIKSTTISECNHANPLV